MAERLLKDSGIEWIGDIPKSWNVLRNKYNFTLSKDIVGPKCNSTQLLSLTKNGIKAITEEEQTGKVPASFATYQKVKKDDIVMCLFDLDVSAVFAGISKYDGMISPAYKCFKCNKNLDPRYIDYYFRTVFVDRKYKRYSKNVRYSLSADEFMTLPIIIPEKEEQTKIANYLDSKCNEIENIIKDIEHQIETLEEYRESLIAETVTNGLNSNVKTKNSGIKWVKEIPNHWNILRVKYISNVIEKGNGITKEQVYPDGDIQCVRYGEIYSKYNNQFINCVSKTKKQEITTKKYFQNGDILCAGTGELVEEIGKSIVYLGNDNCLAGGDIVVIKHKQEPRFFNYALNSQYSQAQKSYSKSKLKVVHISGFEIGNVKLAVPNIAEQKEIADYLDNKYFEIDSIILEKKKQLDTLGEYKKSLIYEYVTGKKEVA